MTAIDQALAAHQSGKLDEAESLYRRILAADARNFDALHMLGMVHFQHGQIEQAEQLVRTALSIRPSIVQCLQNYGNILYCLGRYKDAAESFRCAVIQRPDFFPALRPLVELLLAEGSVAEALDHARRGLAIIETWETKSLVGLCLCSPLVEPGMSDLRALLLRALSEPWADPQDLAATCIRFLGLNETIRKAVPRAAKAWPNLTECLFTQQDLAQFAEDRLLPALLECGPLRAVGWERFATALRFNLLTTARTAPNSAVTEPVLNLYCAIARQCFINDYVFAQSDAEIAAARALRDKLGAMLASGHAVPPLLLMAVAAYFPLHTLPAAEALLNQRWPHAVTALLAQQVREPMEERLARSSMPTLTTIDEAVSLQVRGQYEENPYPKWCRLATPGSRPEVLDKLIASKFPKSPFVALGRTGRVDVLVAVAVPDNPLSGAR